LNAYKEVRARKMTNENGTGKGESHLGRNPGGKADLAKVTTDVPHGGENFRARDSKGTKKKHTRHRNSSFAKESGLERRVEGEGRSRSGGEGGWVHRPSFWVSSRW